MMSVDLTKYFGPDGFKALDDAAATRQKPQALSPVAEGLPAELKEMPQWVCWGYVKRDGAWTKEPYTPLGQRASVTDPSTWSDFCTVWAEYEAGEFDGVGFVFCERDPFLCWDFDEKHAEELPAELMDAARRLGSYCERSPGGVGLHVIVRAKLTGKRNRRGPVECYSHARYIALTGHRIDGTPAAVEARQAEHDALYEHFLADPPQPPAPAARVLQSGETPLAELIRGDISRYGDDDSAADFALCKELLARGLKPAEIVAVWKQSGLARDKLNRLDYIERTLTAAYAEVQREQGPQAQRDNEPLLVSASDIVASARAPDYLVHGLLERDTLATLVGGWGAGKSTLALDWSARIAAGLPIHGRAVKAGPVVIVAGEGHGGIARRLAAWQARHGRPVPQQLYYTRRSVPLREPTRARAAQAEIEDLAQRVGAPALIVVDTLARNFGPGDEASNADMQGFIDALDEHLRLPFGACVLVLHHPGHGDKTRSRGASSLPGGLDVEYLLARDPSDVLQLTVAGKPPRDFAATGALCWRLVPVPLLIDGEAFDAVTVDEVGADDFKATPNTQGIRDTQRGMLDILRDEIERRRGNLEASGYPGAQARISEEDWRQLGVEAKVIKEHRNNFYKVRNSLKKRGLVRIEHKFVELVEHP